MDIDADADLQVPPAFSIHTPICTQTSAPLASTVTSNPPPSPCSLITLFAYSCANSSGSLAGSSFFGITIPASAPYDSAKRVREGSMSNMTTFLTP